MQQQLIPTQNVTLAMRFLDQPTSWSTTGRVAEITLSSSTPATLSDCRALTKTFADLETSHSIEIVLQPENLYREHRHPGLAVFDMDSTLIQQEVIDELARSVGCYDQVAAITESAMRGELDFEQSLKARVKLLKGVPTSIWETLRTSGTITFTPGAADLISALKNAGWKCAVLSGGFTPLANWVKETLGLDYAFANFLQEDVGAGVLTGELVEGKPIVHGEKKKELLLSLAEENGMERVRVVAVGDGSNDLPMMGVAGLGIAFNAKPKVQERAPIRLNSATLRDVLFVLGYGEEEIKGLLKK